MLILSLLLAVGVLVVTPAIARGDVVAGYDLTTCMAKVLHLSTGVMNTYPLPSCGSDFWATMTDSQIAWRSNSTWTVNDYVAGTPGRLLPRPSGDSTTYMLAALTPSGGVLWEGASMAFAYAPSTTAAPQAIRRASRATGHHTLG